jgi:hypothetical protein
MLKLYIIFGIAICLFFAHASRQGWTVADSLASGKWGPQGHNAYHK